MVFIKDEIERLKLEFGRIYDYSVLKEKGFSIHDIISFMDEDRNYIDTIDQ